MYINSEKYKAELREYTEELAEVFGDLKGSHVLITGAAGLIGTYLVDLLLADGTTWVTAVDRDPDRLSRRFSDYASAAGFASVAADINDESCARSLFAGRRVDYVIHAASNTSPLDYAKKPVDTILTNLIGTRNLLECCKDFGVKRFMFCSSVEAYGQGDADSFDEAYSGYVDCNTVRAGYPSGKRGAEAMCNAYRSEYGLDFVTVRIGRIYGATVVPGDTKAVTLFISNAVAGEDIELKSPGTQQFSFGYVGDCASAMLKLLAHGDAGNAYNVADPLSNILLKEFAGAAAQAGGCRVTFNLSPDLAKAGYSKVTKAVLDTKKLESTGWRPLHPYTDGVKRTVEYLRELNND